MITPDDIRNPKKPSGFDHVQYDRHGVRPKRFRAKKRLAAENSGTSNVGPRRATAEEAAQDYCDYVNGGAVATPATLKTAKHPKAAKKPVAPAVQVALDILRDARAPVPTQGWVYLVIEDKPGGGFSQAKIGWTSKNPPEARLSDYQAGNPRKLRMIAKMPGTKADEAALHKKYADNNVLGEWFTVTPGMLLEFPASNEEAA